MTNRRLSHSFCKGASAVVAPLGVVCVLVGWVRGNVLQRPDKNSPLSGGVFFDPRGPNKNFSTEFSEM